MARKGTPKPGVKIEPFLKNGKTLRCQFIKHEKEGQQYGEQCKNPVEPTRPTSGRCKYHGGRAGRKPIHGRYSKYHPVPQGLQQKFEAAVQDPEILDLTKKIALYESQIWKVCEDAQAKENFNEKEFRKLTILIKEQRNLVTQEMERRIAMGAMLDVQQVVVIMGYLYDSVMRNVKDEKIRRAIGADLRKIVRESDITTTLELQEKALQTT